MDKQVAQYLLPDSWLYWTIVQRRQRSQALDQTRNCFLNRSLRIMSAPAAVSDEGKRGWLGDGVGDGVSDEDERDRVDGEEGDGVSNEVEGSGGESK